MDETEGQLSAFIIHHLMDLAAHRKIDIPALLDAAGAPTLKLDNPAGMLPLPLCRKLIHATLAKSPTPAIGLQLSQTSFPAGFGIVGYLAQASPTLGQIIDMVQRYEGLIGDIFSSSVVQEPGVSIWTLHTQDSDPVSQRFMQEFGLGIRYSLLRMVREKRANIVIEIRFQHPKPHSDEELAIYQEVFDCPVRFDQPHSGLVVKSSALKLPLRHLDEGIRHTLEEEANRQLQHRSSTHSVVAHARALLSELIDQGQASRETLADSLGISSRHLHRELRREGTSYSMLLDELRLTRVETLLSSGTTLENIGKQLGFQEPSSFMRWYKKRKGCTARKKLAP